MDQKRIVSLSPAGTEIVWELGLKGQLLESPFDIGLIETLKPDVIILEDKPNENPANFYTVKEALQNLPGAAVKMIEVKADNLDAVFTTIKTVAEALGVPERGEDIIERMQERLDLIRHKLKFIAQKPTVACIERIEPLRFAGNWLPEMVAIAGGKAVLTESGQQPSANNWMDLVQADPEIIIVMPRGFGIERTLKEMDVLLQQPYFKDLQSVKNNQLFIADGNQYFNRSGLRIADAVEILAEIINPKQFIFGYEGAGWIKFSV